MDTCRPTNCTQTPQNQPPHPTTNTQPATKTTKQPPHSPPTRPQNDRTEPQDPNTPGNPVALPHKATISHVSATSQSRLSHPQSPLKRESASRRPYLHPHSRAQKKDSTIAGTVLENIELLYSQRLECWSCNFIKFYFICIFKFIEPILSQRNATFGWSLLS